MVETVQVDKRLLHKLIMLVARGLNEGAYDDIVAGRGYAERVLAWAEVVQANATQDEMLREVKNHA